MLRHFAFFAAAAEAMVDRDGRPFEGCRCVREFKGDVAPPRAFGQDADWQDRVSGRRDGEICLDVTSFDYPEGDFQWWIFRPHDQTEFGKVGLLDFPFTHLFAEIDRATMRLFSYAQSSRPVRSDDRNIVVDITGTPFEQFVRTHELVFGTIVPTDAGPRLVPDCVGEPLGLPAPDGALDLNVSQQSAARVPVGRR